MKSLVMIPAYNEEQNIVKTVRDIQKNAPDFDYIIINDCSRDSTLALCRKEGLHVLSLPVNLGIGGAVQTGYRYAKQNGYDVAVQFDGDGQHDAAYLAKMREKLVQEKLDMVIGSRFLMHEGFQSSGMRRLGIRYFARLIRLSTGKKITDPTSGMRMANRDVIETFAENYPKDYPEPESVVCLLRQGKRVEEAPVKMRERENGKSSISFSKSIYYMCKVTFAILIEDMRRY
ncbi:MAG: glycosyltransferase family 2 protein [Clostridium sp.]|nr:glycosyltransferase family 2 protein [Clostridium sp.]